MIAQDLVLTYSVGLIETVEREASTLNGCCSCQSGDDSRELHLESIGEERRSWSCKSGCLSGLVRLHLTAILTPTYTFTAAHLATA